MAIAHVQDTTTVHATTGTSLQTGAFGANPIVGNYVCAWVWGWAAGTDHPSAVTFSDSATGNTWSTPAGAFKDQSADLWCACGYAKVANTGASFKVTASITNGGGNGGSIVVVASEFSGVAASSPLDGSAVGTTGTSNSVAPGALSFTAGSVVIAVSTDDNTSYGGSTPGGFTRAGNETNGSTYQVGEGIWGINPTNPSNPARTITSAKWAASQFALLAANSDILMGQGLM